MEHTMVDSRLSDSTVARCRAVIITAAPLVLLAAFAYHPHIMFLPSADAVAHAVQADPGRWALAHWGVGIGAALMALAFLAVRGWLQDAGENRWSAIALPFLVFSTSVYAILPGMEFTVLAAAQAGGDIAGAQKVIDNWFVPTMALSGITNAIGATFLARAIRRSHLLGGAIRSLVVTALYVMAVARLIPVGPVHFYVQGLACIAALWPIAREVPKQVHAGGLMTIKGAAAA